MSGSQTHHRHATGHPGFTYNPYEISFCGQAGSSRSTLVSRLARFVFTDHVVGHVNDDVPYQGASTEKSMTYCERTHSQHVVVYPPRKDGYIHPWALIDTDMVLVEEGHDSDLPKIVVLDDMRKGRFSNVIAYVGRGESCAGQATGAPFFQRDNLEEIRNFILGYFAERVRAMPLYGLVLAGGHSTRMNADKAALQYHGRPQVRHACELLDPLCERVFVSSRTGQAEEPALRGLPQIHDTFIDMGPMGGILSAMRAHPQAAWLVLAVDLPLMDGQTLDELIRRRNPFKLATAFVGNHGSLPEPLCAIYEPKSIFRLMHFLAQGLTCPRKVLINSGTQLVEPSNREALHNANGPGDYDEAVALLKAQGRIAP
ncbi:MAG: NTP transferase domain-containing protein [FCB group bacterium]|jgi:molybdopterin-guanine dinucleotide biosynthesis protein A|nr:NTP transferase domain-containing protein [FCB group bacterium]